MFYIIILLYYKCIIENYRPISLLCLSAKIMERVIQDDLLSKTQEFLNATQHGFIPGKSCTTNLITLTDNIANNLAKDIGTDSSIYSKEYCPP